MKNNEIDVKVFIRNILVNIFLFLSQVSSSNISLHWTAGLASTIASLDYPLSSGPLRSPLEIVCTAIIPPVYSSKVLDETGQSN